jgi:hypothetical protein
MHEPQEDGGEASPGPIAALPPAREIVSESDASQAPDESGPPLPLTRKVVSESDPNRGPDGSGPPTSASHAAAPAEADAPPVAATLADERRSGASLGSIFDEDPADEAKPRGEDLRFIVEVPRDALGDPGGFVAEIPLEIEQDGILVRRASFDEDDGVPLRLPESFASGSMLRLRRQGGVREGGIPGDLYLKVLLVEPVGRSLATVPEDLPSLTPWLIGAGTFALVVLGFAYWLLA